MIFRPPQGAHDLLPKLQHFLQPAVVSSHLKNGETWNHQQNYGRWCDSFVEYELRIFHIMVLKWENWNRQPLMNKMTLGAKTFVLVEAFTNELSGIQWGSSLQMARMLEINFWENSTLVMFNHHLEWFYALQPGEDTIIFWLVVSTCFKQL